MILDGHADIGADKHEFIGPFQLKPNFTGRTNGLFPRVSRKMWSLIMNIDPSSHTLYLEYSIAHTF